MNLNRQHLDRRARLNGVVSWISPLSSFFSTGGDALISDIQCLLQQYRRAENDPVLVYSCDPGDGSVLAILSYSLPS